MKKFEVIEIVSNHTLVIQVDDNNVHEGQYIAVLNTEGVPIYDSLDSEIIGYIPTYKAVLNISEINGKIAFCNAIPENLEHDVLIKYSEMQKETFLGEARFYRENERLLHKRINRGDQAIILY